MLEAERARSTGIAPVWDSKSSWERNRVADRYLAGEQWLINTYGPDRAMFLNHRLPSPTATNEEVDEMLAAIEADIKDEIEADRHRNGTDPTTGRPSRPGDRMA